MKTSTAAQCPALTNLGTGVLSKCKKKYVCIPGSQKLKTL